MDTYALQRQLLQAELLPTEKLVGMVLALHMDIWKEYWKSGPATGVLSDRSRVSAIEAEKGPLGV